MQADQSLKEVLRSVDVVAVRVVSSDSENRLCQEEVLLYADPSWIFNGRSTRVPRNLPPNCPWTEQAQEQEQANLKAAQDVVRKVLETRGHTVESVSRAISNRMARLPLRVANQVMEEAAAVRVAYTNRKMKPHQRLDEVFVVFGHACGEAALTPARREELFPHHELGR